jgi:2-deoxy-D-gluconate 3-dehydrogenase
MQVLSSFSLTGKVALVTGCDKGIGKSLALALAEAGADIVGASRTLHSGSDIEIKVTALGRKFYTFQVDLEDRSDIYTFISNVKAAHHIDILVNNAGTIMRAPAAEHSDEFWDKVIKVNLDAAFILTREFGKDMIAKGRGKIVFTCSMLSYQGGLTVPGYTASKSAVAGLLKAFANEWASKGINVNGIAPGYIATDNTQALQDDPARSKSIIERIPSGRWGTPDDLKGAVVFLSSEASNYVQGTILNIDGGWMGR